MPPFVNRLRELHDKAKHGRLAGPELVEYERARTNLGRVLLVAQQISHQGPTLRAALRMAIVVKVDLDLGGIAMERTTTMDVAEGGFAVLLGAAHAVGKPALFVLHLTDFQNGTRRVSGSAKVASCRVQGGLHRVSFTFDAVAAEQRRHLEMVIVDAVLARLPAS